MAGDALPNSKDVELVSPLPLETCCSRMSAEIGKIWAIPGSRPVVGWTSGTKLRIRKRIWYQNSFQTSMFANMVEQDSHTLIRCHFSMHPFVLAFLVVWFGFVSFFSIATFTMFLSGRLVIYQSALQPPWLGLFAPVAMLLFGFGMVRFGRYLARNERPFLLDFVCRILMVDSAGQTKSAR
ncbi:MAG: hypothetical protein INR65_09340 [Gluconacetobacter diazotrophicus]|nr:hypothetical protein [Gluconacetobacter diazotrophicus]